MMKIRRTALLILFTVASLAGVRAQQAGEPPKAAVKTNLLYGAGTLTPNLGVEFGLGRKTTLDLGGGYNPWNLKGSETDNKKLVHWLVQPEFRYWLKERFDGHFFGVHALGGQYNIGGHKIPLLDFKKQYRYEGYTVGGGISYGYLWNWNPRWGMEFTVGVGVAYLNYDKYDCAKCGDKLGNFTKTYFGPTRAGITLVYKIGGKKKSSPQPIAPVYMPPVDPAEVKPEPQPEPQIQPEPTPEPQPTTAEKLATTHGFLAPIAELGDGFSTDPDRYIAHHRDGSLSVYFRQGAKVIDRSYKNNGATLDELLTTVREIENSSDSRVVRVVIAGFASPEGSSAVNDRLAAERAVAIRGYLVDNTSLTGGMVDIHNGGIDWSGLHRLVAESDMTYKQQVLDIIDTVPAEIDYARNTSRKKQLMDLAGGRPWRTMLADIFPDLRNATYIRVYFENK